ncbi:hypothetical protein M569_04162, partial [Genlisea aurea]
VFFLFATSALAAPDDFIYLGCSQIKYAAGSGYESNVNAVLSSIVNSAAFTNYDGFNVSFPRNPPPVYGLFQCRGDLGSSACHDCVSAAVARLGSACAGACGGALQLEGCFVRYDNSSFVGVEDKTVVVDKCGAATGANDADAAGRRDAVLSYLTSGDQYYRVAGAARVQGVAQCVQDLSVGECSDCLSDAVGMLKTECVSASWGDVFLAKCYARYFISPRPSAAAGGGVFGSPAGSSNDEVQRDLAILIGLVAGVTLLVIFLSFYSKYVDRKG